MSTKSLMEFYQTLFFIGIPATIAGVYFWVARGMPIEPGMCYYLGIPLLLLIEGGWLYLRALKMWKEEQAGEKRRGEKLKLIRELEERLFQDTLKRGWPNGN